MAQTTVDNSPAQPSPFSGVLSLLGKENALGIGFAVGFLAGMTGRYEFVIAAISIALTDAADDKVMNEKTVKQINNAPLAVIIGVPIGYLLAVASQDGITGLSQLF